MSAAESEMRVERCPCLQVAAARALGNLALGDQAIIRCMVEQGAVTALVSLADTGTEECREVAAGALSNVAAGCEHTKAAVVRAGALAPLVALLLPSGSRASAQGLLPSGSVGGVGGAEGVPRSGSGSAIEYAAAAVGNLSSGDWATRRAIVRAGAMPPLVALVQVLKGSGLRFRVYLANFTAPFATAVRGSVRRRKGTQGERAISGGVVNSKASDHERCVVITTICS